MKTKDSIWVEHYFYLRDHGYLLRPRYHPDWIPTWLNEDGSFKIDKEYEDFHTPVVRTTLIYHIIRLTSPSVGIFSTLLDYGTGAKSFSK